MQDHVYKMIELAGSSETSIEDAIQNAITRLPKRCTTCAGFR